MRQNAIQLNGTALELSMWGQIVGKGELLRCSQETSVLGSAIRKSKWHRKVTICVMSKQKSGVYPSKKNVWCGQDVCGEPQYMQLS